MTPSSVSASLTSSSLKGLMMASTFFISNLLEDGEDQRRNVRADPLEVRQHVEVDLRGFQRLRETGPEPVQVGFAHLALALAHERPLVEHLLGERAVVGREGGERPLEVLRDQAVELQDLRPAGLREATALIE